MNFCLYLLFTAFLLQVATMGTDSREIFERTSFTAP